MAVNDAMHSKNKQKKIHIGNMHWRYHIEMEQKENEEMNVWLIEVITATFLIN